MTEERKQIIEREAEDFINGLYNEMFRQRPESQIRKAGYISGREEAEAEIEKWKDEYGAMDMIIQEKNEDIKKLHRQVEAAKELIFPYWIKEHSGIPSIRIQDEWQLFCNENNL